MRWLIPIAAPMLLAACMAGPAYQRPAVTVPAGFKEQPPIDPEAAKQWQEAHPGDALHRGRWWEVYGDPVLNALEPQIATANQNVALAAARFVGARAAVRISRADLFPTVNVGVSATAGYGSARRTTAGASSGGSSSSGAAGSAATSTPAVSGTATSYSLTGDFSYEIDLWGRIRRNVESSAATAEATAADLASAQLSMESELASDYFELRGLDALRDLLLSSVDAYQRALQLTQNRHDQGVASGVDVAQAETQLATTRVQATDLEVTRAQFEHAIAVLVGQPPAALSIAPTTARMLPPPIPATVPSLLLQRRPDIAAAERRVAAANAQIGVASAAFFPTVALSAAAGLQSSTFADWFSWPSRFWSLGPSLVLTAFDAGRRRATAEQARANHQAAEAVYRQSVLTAFQDVEDNLSAMRVLAEESVQQAEATSAAERALSLAVARYEGGITTYLEVVTAQTAALTNERAAVDLTTRRMAASVQLVRALGGTWE